MTLLKLKKCGCDFVEVHNEKCAKESDLENFRLDCYIVKDGVRHWVEFLTGDRHYYNDKGKLSKDTKVFTLIDASVYETRDCYGARMSSWWGLHGGVWAEKLQPTKQAILEWVNRVFGTDYDGIELLPIEVELEEAENI